MAGSVGEGQETHDGGVLGFRGQTQAWSDKG